MSEGLSKTEKACIRSHIIRCLQWSVCIGSAKWDEGRYGHEIDVVPPGILDGLVAWSMHCDDTMGKALIEAHWVLGVGLGRLSKLAKTNAGERMNATWVLFYDSLPEVTARTLLYWGKKGWREDDEADDNRRRFESHGQARKVS